MKALRTVSVAFVLALAAAAPVQPFALAGTVARRAGDDAAPACAVLSMPEAEPRPARRLLRLTNLRDTPNRPARALRAPGHSEPSLFRHSEPRARNLDTLQRRDPSRCSG
jgi:hypothetical protein